MTTPPLQIVEAKLHRVSLPLVHEFETSSHRKRSLEHILVRLWANDGTVAWGEIASPSDPYFAAETVDTCWLVAERYLLPGLVGASWRTPDEAVATWSLVRGNNFAKAGVDAAIWALHAASTETSLADTLGGTRTEAIAGVSLGIERSAEATVDQVHTHVASGYGRVKLKIRPGWDVEVVRAVRAEFPELILQVDANGAYPETPEALAALHELDGFGLAMIEQPFAPRNLLAHARLQADLETPVCLDESIETVEDLETAIQLGAGRIINIKVSRMGGLTEARRAHDIARAAGIPVWCGGMHEFGVGRAANLALCSLPGFTLPSDVSGSAKYYERDVITAPIVANDGRVDIPSAPGLGVDVDTEFIDAMSSRVATVGQPGG
jgi:O-succinylbenzoate synthase